MQVGGRVLMPLVVDSRHPRGASASLGLEFAHEFAVTARRVRVESRRCGRDGVPRREGRQEQSDAHQGEEDDPVAAKGALPVPPGRCAPGCHSATSSSPSPCPRSSCARPFGPGFVGAEVGVVRIGPTAVVTARGVPGPVIVRAAVAPRPAAAHRASPAKVILGRRLRPRRDRSSCSSGPGPAAAAPAESGPQVRLAPLRVGQELVRGDDRFELVVIVDRLALAFVASSACAAVRVVQLDEFEVSLLPPPARPPAKEETSAAAL